MMVSCMQAIPVIAIGADGEQDINNDDEQEGPSSVCSLQIWH